MNKLYIKEQLHTESNKDAWTQIQNTQKEGAKETKEGRNKRQQQQKHKHKERTTEGKTERKTERTTYGKKDRQKDRKEQMHATRTQEQTPTERGKDTTN